MTRYNLRLLLTVAALLPSFSATAAEGPKPPLAEAPEITIHLGTKSGLQFDKPRLAVKSGVPIELRFKNTDEMAHNFVLTKPNTRLQVVQEALILGADGPKRDYVPESQNVLVATKVILPGKEQVLRFMSPEKPGIYPYVCTFPGHGFIMYGALYVDTVMPELAKDTNIPGQARSEVEPRKDLHAFGQKRPIVYRIFMPDAGPAAIAVGLPRQINYCFDAGQCRLRYAWHGDFVDPMPVWKGNGNGLATIPGHIFWRATDSTKPPVRVGSTAGEMDVKFLGYRMVGGNPKYRYKINDVEVQELIRPTPKGVGVQRDFTIGATEDAIFFVAEHSEGVTVTSSVGDFDKGVLRLTGRDTKTFTITMQHQMQHTQKHDTAKGGAR